jgi:predicted ATPase
MSNWNVITAGPSAGKSSTVRELSSRGYTVGPEAARILFDQAISEGRDPSNVRNDDDFHQQVERIDRRIENNLPEDEIVFLDRSLADNMAYRVLFENTDSWRYNELDAECHDKYDNVFLLDRIKFTDDDVRSENEERAQRIHKELRRAYTNLGYDVHEIPVMPVDTRATTIARKVAAEDLY